jgi:hypothetical protein
MIHPSRLIESTLHALGAEPQFRDDLLGDLAEELAVRAERDGRWSARLWYYREAIRAVPHLLRSWSQQLRFRSVARLAAAVVGAFVLLKIASIIDHVIAIRTIEANHIGTSAAFTIHAILRFAHLVLGGYLAAWLGGREGLIAALAFGALQSAVSVAVWSLADVSVWFSVSAAGVTLVGTMSGAVLRLRTSPIPV